MGGFLQGIEFVAKDLDLKEALGDCEDGAKIGEFRGLGELVRGGRETLGGGLLEGFEGCLEEIEPPVQKPFGALDTRGGAGLGWG